MSIFQIPHLSKPGLPLMGIGGLLADPLGVSTAVVLEAVHSLPVPRAISGQFLYTALQQLKRWLGILTPRCPIKMCEICVI